MRAARWHDDPAAKFEALQAWRADFKAAHKREPTIWLDKFCIHADAVADTLPLLPVFLAGCSTFVILCGDTYMRRLWCAAELYIFFTMGGVPAQVSLHLFGASSAAALEAFEVRDATCQSRQDLERLVTMVEAGPGGLDGFNDVVRNALATLSKQSTTRSSVTSTSRASTGTTGSRDGHKELGASMGPKGDAIVQTPPKALVHSTSTATRTASAPSMSSWLSHGT